MLLIEKYYGFFVLTVLGFTNIMGRTLKDFPEECFTATEIDDDTRAFENYDVPTSKADDLDLKKGWYRIMGKSSNSLKQGFDKLLKGNKRNPPNFCGTVYAGTLMGSHPTVEEGMVEMTVCFRRRFCFHKNIDACTCKSKRSIYVRNCQNHYIYWLSPTGRQERYCTGRTSLFGPRIENGSSTAVECTQHSLLDGTTRTWNEIGDVTCDKKEGWYRFTNMVGKELASKCSVNDKSISRLSQPCGASFRGWMVDRHPTLAEGRRNARICFSYPDSCSCEFYSNIGVRNCGGSYVYRIRSPPICNSRYCGAPKGSPASSNDLIKPSSSGVKNICDMYQVMHDPHRLWSYTSPTELNCDANLYGQYRFGSKYTPWSIKEGCNKTQMQVVIHRCGTRYQGFMEDRHPTVSEKYVERIICFQDPTTVPCECQFSAIIGIQNCSGFYVYDLRGVPKCEAGFCMVANGSETIKIDPDRPPLYNIPSPGYDVVVVEKSTKPGKDGGSVITTTVLCIIILIVLILIVVIILTVLYVAHPVLCPNNKDREDKVKILKVYDAENSDIDEKHLNNKVTDDHLENNQNHLSAQPNAPPAEIKFDDDDITKQADSGDDADEDNKLLNE